MIEAKQQTLQIYTKQWNSQSQQQQQHKNGRIIYWKSKLETINNLKIMIIYLSVNNDNKIKQTKKKKKYIWHIPKSSQHHNIALNTLTICGCCHFQIRFVI